MVMPRGPTDPGPGEASTHPACERSSCESETRIIEKQASLTSIPEEEHVLLAHVETLKGEPSGAQCHPVPELH